MFKHNSNMDFPTAPFVKPRPLMYAAQRFLNLKRVQAKIPPQKRQRVFYRHLRSKERAAHGSEWSCRMRTVV